MLMAPATHAVGSSSTSSSISPPAPPPWHPVVLVPNHHHQQHQVLYDDLDLTTPSPPHPRHSHTHIHLRPTASRQRAAGKQQRRRPRPSRKLQTTTYISADAASFRRMVHQVTGFDDDRVPLLHLPAPLSRGALTTTTETMLLPTLDTPAFLMLGTAAGGVGRGGAAPARPPGVSSCCHGSAAVDPGAVALEVTVEGAACGGRGGGFPSLESWDEDDALFLEFARR